MKVFLSQPMNGRTNEEIIIERDKAIKMMRQKYGDNAKVLDSLFLYAPEIENKSVYMLGEAIKIMSKADVVVYIGSPTSPLPRGCSIEKEICMLYNIPYVCIPVE